MQLFKLLDSKEIALVNLSASEMSEDGEMQAWRVALENDQSLVSNPLTWNDLEAGALLLSWNDLPEDFSVKFKDIIEKIDITNNIKNIRPSFGL